MDQRATFSAVSTELETTGGTVQNDRARVASRLGIVGAVLVVGVLALTANAVITAFATPDFMPTDASDDPFLATGIACVVPSFLGFVGLIYSIGALRVVSVRGERTIAIRGLVLGILNVLLPIAVGVVVVHFDQMMASCGGG
ncbi:MAG TPA: hypothetical protein VGI56_01470 [Galbitalea sp.]